MVRMMPPSTGANTSYGERAIFEKLSQDTSHASWTVIHGLKQDITLRQHQAEGDFVVLVPGKGLVIIEVKGATAATLEGETWTFDGVAEGAVHKSPLDQIEVTRTNIKRRFRDNDLDDFAIPMARLVWLPKLEPFQFADIAKKGLLLGHWEMAFRPDLQNAAKTIETCLDEHIRFMADNPDVRYKPESFTQEYAAKVVNFLLVDARAHASVSHLSEIQGSEIARATEAQMQIVDSIIDNQNIYLEGAAGTGKSRMLGLAAVKLANEGRRVLLTCYNLMMADFFAEEYGRHPRIDVISTHDLFFQTIPQKQGKEGQHWFDVELPTLAKNAIRVNPSLAVYDAICIDEFQDISTKDGVIDAIFAYFSPHGAFNPRVVLAGDDEQNLFGVHDGTSSFGVAKELFQDLMKVKLLNNCRQAPALSDAVFKFIDFKVDGLRHAVPKDVDSKFEVVRTQTGNETKELASVLRELLKTYRPEQIRVLSPYGKSALIGGLFTREPENADERWIKENVRHESTQGQIRWRSIGKFKGLESDVVVITDINQKSNDWAESKGLWLRELLYVGMTRARFHLVLMVGDGLFPGKG